MFFIIPNADDIIEAQNNFITTQKNIHDSIQEELTSIIRVNQSYDFKSKNSIYKGDKYKFYPRIQDNLPLYFIDCKEHKSSKENYEKTSEGLSSIISNSIIGTNANTIVGDIALIIIGVNPLHINVLNLAKSGLDLSSLDSVAINAEKN